MLLFLTISGGIRTINLKNLSWQFRVSIAKAMKGSRWKKFVLIFLFVIWTEVWNHVLCSSKSIYYLTGIQCKTVRRLSVACTIFVTVLLITLILIQKYLRAHIPMVIRSCDSKIFFLLKFIDLKIQIHLIFHLNILFQLTNNSRSSIYTYVCYKY